MFINLNISQSERWIATLQQKSADNAICVFLREFDFEVAVYLCAE